MGQSLAGRKKFMNKKSSIWFGGDYNPEQWEKDVWNKDMRLFRQAYINTATINVFSWALLEPKEGEYNFTLLDEIVDTLTKNQMNFIMATSTAALPAWLCRQYPEVTRVDYTGKKKKFGGRHNHCPNSEKFRERASALVKQIAKRYANHPNLVAWHVSNEYGGNCYCENCEKAFRQWLKKKYGSIDVLNRAWNTNFWGHTFYDFDEIVVPNALADGMSCEKAVFGGLSLDYRRFQSQSLLDNYKMERDMIRKYDSHTPITTNLMGAFKDLDYFEWGKEMDVISWDSYPKLDTPYAYTSMMHDLMRGLKEGKPFLLMEQTPNQQNWQPNNSLKRPGVMALQSMQAMAHGADSILYFQLRQSKNGCEKFHGAVISHEGSAEGRIYRETAKLGEELLDLQEIKGTKIKAEVGILFDWDSWWGIDMNVGPSNRLDYVKEVYRYYEPLNHRNVAIDLVGKDQDFSKYKILILPLTYICDQELTAKLEQFVRDGGIFVTNVMSGMADKNDNIYLGGYPGLWRDLCGIKVDEIDALFPDHFAKVDLLGKKVKGEILAALILNRDAQPIGVYESEFYAGTPAVCEHSFGLGQSVYVGTLLDDQGMSVLTDYLLEKAQISQRVIENVEIVTRENTEYRYVFYMNHSDETKKINNKLVLGPYETKIVKEKK